jgi:hypothetical protein
MGALVDVIGPVIVAALCAMIWLGSQLDRRIGTYFDSSGNAFRVNGVITGNKLDFYIDCSQPDQPYDQLSGDH